MSLFDEIKKYKWTESVQPIKDLGIKDDIIDSWHYMMQAFNIPSEIIEGQSYPIYKTEDLTEGVDFEVIKEQKLLDNGQAT